MNYNTIIENSHADLPCAFVDLDAFDANIKSIANTVAGTGLTIRVATKSIRVPELIRRVLDYGSPFKGLMCYAAQEAKFLSEQGFDDFLLAYPTLQASDLKALREVHESGKIISMVVDDERHLQIINEFMKGVKNPFPVLVEPDLSIRISGLVIGVRRSSLKTVEQVVNFAKTIDKYPNLKFHGLMAYEAQVAGVGDKNPFKPILSPILKIIRRISIKRVIRKRKFILDELKKINKTPVLFNGGGTGSLSFNRAEAGVLTELTSGSGFYCPHLFDYYSNLDLKPAAFFALQVVRNPEPHWFTCLGGGYVASGEPGWDRVPKPMISRLELSGFEATGEVQTPINSPQDLRLGSTVIFRHAKAGELFERFNEATLLQNGKVTKLTKSYRGLNQNFF
jgi:D-serine deaminase-like pyridoxal phosphate-dependent protein